MEVLSEGSAVEKGEVGKSGKHWKSEYKGAAVVSVRGVWLCLQCDMCAGQDSKK